MGVPVQTLAAIAKVLKREGIHDIRHIDLNNLIAALSPCFEPGYPQVPEPDSLPSVLRLIARYSEAIAQLGVKLEQLHEAALVEAAK